MWSLQIIKFEESFADPIFVDVKQVCYESRAMRPPLINLDQLELQSDETGAFAGSYAAISPRVGAQKFGYNLTILPPPASVRALFTTTTRTKKCF